jgi:L,D-peptidoglycan transpeptidase YkuD (ErfK/YbiS/YcfS/YnhG family)
VVAVVIVGLVVAACGSPGPTVGGAPAGGSTSVPATSESTSTAPPTSSSTTAAAPAVTEVPTSAPVPGPPGPDSTAAAPAAPGWPAELDRAGDAGQAVVVTAAGYGATTATLSTWQRAAGGWEAVDGPWPANVGRAGFAPPGEKREGDGRTPSGTFGFDFAFGVQPDPGVALPYRRVTVPAIVWDDDPSSPSYNLWVDGGRGEAMYQSPAYDYGAVIAYNTARTPGLGSAIFLNVSTGGPTAGCVSLPVERLLQVLRWLDPARAPVMVMGVA